MVTVSSPHLATAVQRIAPGLRVLSSSVPDPTLRRYNLLLVQRDLDAARRLVVELEDRLDDATVEFMSLGRRALADTPGALANDADEPGGAGDDLVRWWGRPVALGSVIGGLIGAAVFAAAGVAIGARGGGLAGTIVGGALLVSVFAAIWVAFGRMGGSDAFRQTFIPHDANDVAVVAVLTDDRETVAELYGHADDRAVSMVELDARGRVISGLPTR